MGYLGSNTKAISSKYLANQLSALKTYFNNIFASSSSLDEASEVIEKLKTSLNRADIINANSDYATVTMSASQTTDLTAGSYIKLDTISSDSMTLSDNGYVMLKANKTYLLTSTLLGIAENAGLCMYDVTNSVTLGKNMTIIAQNSNIGYNVLPFSFAIVTPTADIEVGIKINWATNLTSLDANYCALTVMEIGRSILINPPQCMDEKYGIEDAPVGSIIQMMSLTAPKHYLICDGTVYNIADYPKLAAYILSEFGSYNYWGGDGITTFAVPDMRGEFIRGVDQTSLRDPEGSTRGVGKHQSGTELPMFGGDATWNIWSYRNATSNSAYPKNIDKETIVSTGKAARATISNDSDASWSHTESYTTRPTNVNVLFCIKYEPTYFMTYNSYATQVEDVLAEGELSDGTYALSDNITKYDSLKFIAMMKLGNSTDTYKTIPIVENVNVSDIVYLGNDEHTNVILSKSIFNMAQGTVSQSGQIEVTFSSDKQIAMTKSTYGDISSFAITKIIGIRTTLDYSDNGSSTATIEAESTPLDVDSL